MTSLVKVRTLLRSFLLGQAGFTAAFDFPLAAPQTEIGVWLHGSGEPREVTDCHAVACPKPSIFCISSETMGKNDQHIRLLFRERREGGRVLGEIRLQHQSTIKTSGPELLLYRAEECVNRCLSTPRSAMRSLCLAYDRRKVLRSGKDEMSALDQTCNEVAFICPRPVVLVSLGKGDAGNIFPMNLMGQVGEHHFVFALNQSRKVGAAISSISELAISTIPFQHADVVRELGRNHHRSSINLRELPFRLGPSESLHIPIPEFALTVRELRVEHMVPLGSHDFFIARILTTQIRDEAPEFFRVHGLYAARR